MPPELNGYDIGLLQMPCSFWAQVSHLKSQFTVGVLTGIISSCGSLERLSRDHVLPDFFRRRIKLTDAPYISIIIFVVIGLAMYGVVDANITILAGQFVISFILIMGLFALSNLYLKFNRDRLVRHPRVGLPTVILALGVVVAAIAGNIALSPVIAGYFTVFFVIALLAMTYTGFRGRLATTLYWIYNRNEWLHSCRWTKTWDVKLIDKIKKSKKQPIVFFAKTDEVNSTHWIPLIIDFHIKRGDSLYHSQRMYQYRSVLTQLM
jgi:hypothetical protein